MSFHFVEVLLTGCKREKRAANWWRAGFSSV